MRILHTEWSDGWGGQERRVLSEMAGMAARGHDLFLVTRPHSHLRREAEAQGIPVSTLPLRGPADLFSIHTLARWLRRWGVDVVNTHSGRDSWVGGLAARLARTPVLLRTRHLNLPLRRSWRNFVHRLPDRVVTCGDAMRRQLIEDCGFPPHQLVSIPTGVDFDRFVPRLSRPELRRSLGLKADDFLVLMVGIIRGVKRHELALRAMPRVLETNPHAHLLIAGDGPMRADAERLTAELGLSKQVHFLGYRDDVADLMGAVDLLLLTSRSEGVPQAVTQALGLALPVVATAVGGVVELVKHERTGFLVPPEDADSVARAVLRVATALDEARLLAVAGRTHVLKRYSLQAMLNSTQELCDILLAEKRGSHH
jgi:glycosyltransferase involved in cell wall biosynthesis